MLPNPIVFGDDVLMIRHSKSFTSKNYDDFFKEINYHVGKKIYQRTSSFLNGLSPPNVKVRVVISNKVKTVESFEYDKIDEPPIKINSGDGDGTVNMKSL